MVDDGLVGAGEGSPAGSQTSLTGEYLRRRPSHSRRQSSESVEADVLLPAMDAMHLRGGAAGGNTPPRRDSRESLLGERGPGARARRGDAAPRSDPDAATGSDASMGSSAASPSASPRPTASSRPPLAPAARAIRAAVASGGYLVDRATERGAVRREYVGGDVAIATVPRGCDFRAFLVAVGVEPEPRDAILDRDDDMNDDDANANDEESPNNVEPILRAAERLKVHYRDPSDGVTLIRVRRDDDVARMFEEWDAAAEAKQRGSATTVEKLRVYVSTAVPVAGGGGALPPRLLPDAEETTAATREASSGASSSSPAGGGASTRDASADGAEAAALQVIPSGELELVNRLGGGAFGEVHLALWRGSEVAVKFLHALREDALDSDDDDDDDVEAAAAAAAAAHLEGGISDDRPGRRGGDFSGSQTLRSSSGAAHAARGGHPAEEEFLRESRTMAALQHPNVVFVYGVVRDGARLGIVEEFMRSGSLRRLLNAHERELAKSPPVPPRERKHALSALQRAECALDVARGMAYLHSKRFVHFDLKCDNVLTAKTSRGGGGGGGATVRCKVCDFGLSKRRGSRASFVSGINAHRGTLPWTAPELLCDPGRASEKVDVHSFAVLMWELWTGRYPFEGQREQTIMYAIMTGGRPELPPEEEDDAGMTGGGFSVPRGVRGGEGERSVGSDGEKGGGLEKTGASEKDGRRAEDNDVENARAAGGSVSESSSDVHPGGDGSSTNELGFIPEPCEGWRGLIEASWAEAPERRPSFDALAEVLEKGVGRARERREARRIAAAAERKRLAAEKENEEKSPSATS